MDGGSAKSPVRPRPGAGAQMPAEHALLGLIVLAGGEAYGYELARRFSAEDPLGEVFRLEQAMLYQHLKKLERLGWLTMELQPQEARPPRRMYGITAAGRAELDRWLREPVARTREIRLEFLVKLFLAIQLDRALASRLVTEQLAVCRQLVASIEGQMQMAALDAPAPDAVPEGDERFFERIVLELRRDQTRAAAAWLERIEAWLDGNSDSK
jgi:PadR family transcriptional regulator, regulatory protein AphA